jgi:hypothetical protein
MERLYRVLSVAVAGLALLAGALHAHPAAARSINGGPGLVPEASGAAQSTARLTALIGQNGVVIRSKNVASVTNPSTGITCIRPAAGSGISIGRIVPSVNVEWGWSSGNDLVAYYFSNEPTFFTDCPRGHIEVRTYDFAGNLSSRVAFTIVVD